MSLAAALLADRSGELQSAATAYEALLARGETSLEVVLNLALLYWQSTDTGLSASKQLSPEFMEKASIRFPELLAEAQRRFPADPRARFWARYIGWTDLGEPFGLDECRAMIGEDPASLLPAMHVFALSNGRVAEREAIELLRRCQEDGTTGARYVASVIEGIRKRRTRAR